LIHQPITKNLKEKTLYHSPIQYTYEE